MMSEAENDFATNGPVQVGVCEFCDEPFEDCECGEAEPCDSDLAP